MHIPSLYSSAIDFTAISFAMYKIKCRMAAFRNYEFQTISCLAKFGA